MKKGDLLFVYGTLRVGEGMDLSRRGGSGVSYLGEDHVNGQIYHLGGFPGAKLEPQSFCPGSPFIKGDVFRIEDESIIFFLDSYEGYPHLYDRVQTVSANGETVWVYTINREVDPATLIKSGDWKNQPSSLFTTVPGISA